VNYLAKMNSKAVSRGVGRMNGGSGEGAQKEGSRLGTIGIRVGGIRIRDG